MLSFLFLFLFYFILFYFFILLLHLGMLVSCCDLEIPPLEINKDYSIPFHSILLQCLCNLGHRMACATQVNCAMNFERVPSSSNQQSTLTLLHLHLHASQGKRNITFSVSHTDELGRTKTSTLDSSSQSIF